MNTVDVSAETAEDALVRLARHVPTGVPIGRPCAALDASDDDNTVVFVTTEAAFWWSHPGRACRLDQLDDGRIELTEWRFGMETSRSIADVH